MTEPTVAIKRRLSADKLRRASQVYEEGFFVFLAGPVIEPGDKEKSDQSPAGQLRYNLFYKLQEDKCEISLGEYKHLKDLHKDILGKHNNAAIAELHHAREVADAIIIIVGSPGSFAEIGAFSSEKEICEKMLILSDEEHENSPGYVANGPFPMAVSFGATLKYIDLTDVSAVSKLCQGFIRDRSHFKALQRMVRG